MKCITITILSFIKKTLAVDQRQIHCKNPSDKLRRLNEIRVGRNRNGKGGMNSQQTHAGDRESVS